MTKGSKNENENMQKAFDEASEESWWYCLNPSCRCAYQKAECKETGVCPHCEDTEFNSEPWDSAMLNNPHFPRLPVSGQTYNPG